MFRPVYSCKTKPNNQAIIIDAKNEGKDIPNTEINKMNLSTNVSLYSADKTPKNNPIKNAIKIEVNARKKVLLKVSANIIVTGMPDLTKEFLR